MKWMLSTLMVLGFSVAKADMMGAWSGDVVREMGGEAPTNEFVNVDAQMAQDANSLTVTENFYGMSYAFDVVGSELFFGSEKVGEVSDMGISFSFMDPVYAGCKESWSLKMDGDHANYSDEYTCDDGYSDKISGPLMK